MSQGTNLNLINSEFLDSSFFGEANATVFEGSENCCWDILIVGLQK